MPRADAAIEICRIFMRLFLLLSAMMPAIRDIYFMLFTLSHVDAHVSPSLLLSFRH